VVGIDANLLFVCSMLISISHFDSPFSVVPIARLPAELQDIAFWLNNLLLGAPAPKALRGGSRAFISAKMVQWASRAGAGLKANGSINGLAALIGSQQEIEQEKR
jgi:hypothetical protein